MMSWWLILTVIPSLPRVSGLWLMVLGCVCSVGKCCSEEVSYIMWDASKMSLTLMALSWVILLLMNLSAPPSMTLLWLTSVLAMILMNLFIVNNVVPFYVWFEFSLLPMSGIILGWGLQPERLSAATYMLFYTILSALPFLGVVLYKTTFVFSMIVLITSKSMTGVVLGLSLTMPFLVKTPMYLVHLWLPKAHVEAPVYGSMVLAGVLLKIGGIGLLRVMPLISFQCGVVVGVVSAVGGVVASLVTMTQVDIKSLIAYSSVVHMSLTITCLLMGSSFAPSGVWLMLLGHGVASSGLFYLATMNYSRINTRSLIVAQGVLLLTPGMALSWVILLLMNLSAPPSMTLLSEITMIYNCFMISPSLIFGIGVMVVTVLIYSLQLYYSYFHGAINWVAPVNTETLKEIITGSLHAWWFILSPLVFYLLE